MRGLVHRVLQVGKFLESDKNDAFSAAMSLIVSNKDSAYTDFLLATVLHNFHGGFEKNYILSVDAPAFPPDIFTIEGVISVRLKKGDIVHLNLIALDSDKYEAIMKEVLGR